MDDRFQPLGPAGIQSRMQEIQAKMNRVFGTRSLPQGAPSFSDLDVRPLDPKAPGIALRPSPNEASFKPMIDRAAQASNVDADLLSSLVDAESSYDPSARSSVGAMGLTQLMPDTAKAMGVQDPFDPQQNLNGGAKYLRHLLDQFNDVPKALAAYNAGPGAVNKFGGVPPYGETQRYVQRIMGAYEARKRGNP